MTRILVVEDSATQAEELRLILEAQGFEVETASDGALGLERLRTGHFDLVISDIQMPGLSGYEFCRSAKENPALKTIPIVLLTTLSDPLDVSPSIPSNW
jgi:CheY-like chemotaxis protein